MSCPAHAAPLHCYPSVSLQMDGHLVRSFDRLCGPIHYAPRKVSTIYECKNIPLWRLSVRLGLEETIASVSERIAVNEESSYFFLNFFV